MDIPSLSDFRYIIFNSTANVEKAIDLHDFFLEAKIAAFKKNYGTISSAVFPRGFRATPDFEMAVAYGSPIHEDAVELFIESRALTVAEQELEIRRVAN
jgi:hypothetical protein